MSISGAINDYSATLDERTKSASVAQAINFHDTNEITFTDAEEETTKFCRAFHCNATGTLSCIFAQDSTAVSLKVTQGLTYSYSVKVFRNTGTDLLDGEIIALR